MCGLAGAIAVAPDARVDRERLRRMAALMGHRGPDAVGSWSDPAGRAALVHRRLSVIDIEGGGQPMSNDSGDIVLVFNGEMYNYREERQLLLDAGVTFRTNSDTEVLLRLYERYGAECVHRLRGMFAFAVWDANRGELLVARDRVGKKPLFYALENGCFYFASTLNALHDTSEAPPRMNLEALDAFLGLGYIPAPLSIWENMSKLPAATLLSVSQQGLRAARYWDLGAEREPFGGGFDDAVDHLDELLNTAVSLRLRSDVPLGVFLSGGIDSSLVAAIAKRQSASSTLTFAIGFEDPAFDESIFAERIAAHLGTEHRTFHGRPEMMHVLPELVHHFGEPFGDSSALATFLLAREARAHVTVALTGDGGDEGFGGYDWYRNALRLKRLRQVIPAPVAWAGALASRAFDRDSRIVQRAGRGLRVLALGEAQRFGALRTFINRDQMHMLYAGELRRTRAQGGFPADDWIAARYAEASGTALRRMRFADVSTYLADDLMPKVDVTTMAHGLEARAPLLDQEVLQFALSLRDDWLLDGNGGKGILKALLRRYVPTSLFQRPKQGFAVPLRRWFAGSARTDVLDDLHHAEALLDTGWFHARGIQQLVSEHKSGLRDHTQRLYDLVVLREWLGQR